MCVCIHIYRSLSLSILLYRTSNRKPVSNSYMGINLPVATPWNGLEHMCERTVRNSPCRSMKAAGCSLLSCSFPWSV